MLGKILAWLGLSGILLAAVIYSSVYFISQTKESKGVLSVVDNVQDIQVTGFPDSRKIAADSQGNIYVAYRKEYRQKQLTQQHIFVARSSDGGQSWQVLNGNKPVETVGDYNQRVPSIVVDEQDVIHVVWYGNDAEHDGQNERQIKYVRSSDGGATWSGWANLAVVKGYDDDELWQEHPVIYSRENAVYVVWQGRDTDFRTSQARFARSLDNGQTWSVALIISPDPGSNFSRPSLAAAPDGILYVLAYSAVGGVQQIVWSRSQDDGVTWNAWRPIAGDGMDQRHLSIVVDNASNLHVVWRQMPPTEDELSQIYYAVFNGRSWTTPIPIASTTTGNQYFPSTAFDENGNFFVAWMETPEKSGFPSEKPTNGDVYYKVKNGAGWSAVQQVTRSGDALYPSLMSVKENVAAIWLERSGDRGGKILYSTLQLPEIAEK